jgi:hydrogenase-4 component F
MASTVLPVVLGPVPADAEVTEYRDIPSTVLPLVVLMGIVLMLGVWLPQPLYGLLHEAAAMLGGS